MASLLALAEGAEPVSCAKLPSVAPAISVSEMRAALPPPCKPARQSFSTNNASTKWLYANNGACTAAGLVQIRSNENTDGHGCTLDMCFDPKAAMAK